MVDAMKYSDFRVVRSFRGYYRIDRETFESCERVPSKPFLRLRRCSKHHHPEVTVEQLRVSKIKLDHGSSMEDVMKQLDFRVVRPFRGYH